MPKQPRSIVVPKVEDAGDLVFVERLLDSVEAASQRQEPLRIQALIETASGLARIEEIANASARLESLILGYADLAASLGGSRDLNTWFPAQHAVIVAARACGLHAVDGPYLGVNPDDEFLAAARRARDLGFDGKWTIHPSQIEYLHALFTPSEVEIGRARRVVEALDRAAQDGQGAVAIGHEMIDEAMKAAALRVLAAAGPDS